MLDVSDHPRRFQFGDLLIDRAIGVVRAGQVTRAEQQFLDDLPAGEDEGSFQDLNAMPTRKASCFQRKSFSNRQTEIISNTKVDTWRRFTSAARAANELSKRDQPFERAEPL